jgi:CBS domain containing-hemolysin-like protein
LLAASALFSSTEIAVFSLPEEWLAERVTAGDRRAATRESRNRTPTRAKERSERPANDRA